MPEQDNSVARGNVGTADRGRTDLGLEPVEIRGARERWMPMLVLPGLVAVLAILEISKGLVFTAFFLSSLLALLFLLGVVLQVSSYRVSYDATGIRAGSAYRRVRVEWDNVVLVEHDRLGAFAIRPFDVIVRLKPREGRRLSLALARLREADTRRILEVVQEFVGRTGVPVKGTPPL